MASGPVSRESIQTNGLHFFSNVDVTVDKFILSMVSQHIGDFADLSDLIALRQ